MIKETAAKVCVPDMILGVMGVGICLMIAGSLHRGIYILGVILSVASFASIFKYV